MTIALIGATGRVGSRLATELLSHGHAVTGIALHVPPDVRPGLTVLEADATRPDSLAPRLMGHDGVISALRFVTSDADALIAAVKTAGVKRLLVVSGAGSLEIAPGKTLMDTDGFPDAFKTDAKARARFLENSCRSLISTGPFFPSADFAPGERTGRFRLGGDQLLTDAKRKSHVSMEDSAIAMVEEVEQPVQSRQQASEGHHHG